MPVVPDNTYLHARSQSFHAWNDPYSRTIALAASILLVFLLPPAVSAEEEASRKKVVFWNLFTGGSSHEVVTELVARFNRRHTEYVVEQVDIPGNHITSKILPAVAGELPPI